MVDLKDRVSWPDLETVVISGTMMMLIIIGSTVFDINSQILGFIIPGSGYVIYVFYLLTIKEDY